MNKTIKLSIACALFLAFYAVKPLAAQSLSGPADSLKPIPNEVLNVFKKACADCHAEPGKPKALAKLNYSKWNEYSAEKQASKAKAIVDVVSTAEMPPKWYLENNPGAAATADDLKVLSDWVKRMSGTSK